MRRLKKKWQLLYLEQQSFMNKFMPKVPYMESDHRPLESLFKKALSQTPPRIQRMMLKVQKYDLHVKYKKGTELYIADTLSRACISQNDDYICDSDYSVFSIEALPVSQAKLSELREETRKDMELTILKDTILNGWLENKKQLNPCITHFWNFRDEISHFDGLMLKGEKVIIPKSMQKSVIEQIHQKSHLGITSV